MHEIGVTRSILDIVIKYARDNNVRRVLTVYLKIGELSDLEGEWIQRYFDYLSRGTVAQGAQLSIERVAATSRCGACQSVFEIDVHQRQGIRCPKCCSDNCTLASGDEYRVETMEAL